MSNPVKRRINRISVQTDRPFSAKPSNEEWINLFPQDCRFRNLSQRSISYDSTLHYLLQVLKEQKQSADFDQITADTLQRHFLGYMLEKQLAPQTINGFKLLLDLFSILASARAHSNKSSSSLTSVKAPKDAIATFSPDELVRLLRQPDQSTFTGLCDYTILLLLLDTGIRIGELLSLPCGRSPSAGDGVDDGHGKGSTRTPSSVPKKLRQSDSSLVVRTRRTTDQSFVCID